MHVTMSVACSAQEIDLVHEDPTTASTRYSINDCLHWLHIIRYDVVPPHLCRKLRGTPT